MINGYPFEESIRSVLPIVDEFICAVGDGDDDTCDCVLSQLTQRFACSIQHGTSHCETGVSFMGSKKWSPNITARVTGLFTSRVTRCSTRGGTGDDQELNGAILG